MIDKTKDDQRYRPSFEIGSAYRKGRKVYLGIAKKRLLTFISGSPSVIAPENPFLFKKIPEFPAEDLEQEWGISIAEVDRIFLNFRLGFSEKAS